VFDPPRRPVIAPLASRILWPFLCQVNVNDRVAAQLRIGVASAIEPKQDLLIAAMLANPATGALPPSRITVVRAELWPRAAIAGALYLALALSKLAEKEDHRTAKPIGCPSQGLSSGLNQVGGERGGWYALFGRALIGKPLRFREGLVIGLPPLPRQLVDVAALKFLQRGPSVSRFS
jgi:hypothetical protein